MISGRRYRVGKYIVDVSNRWILRDGARIEAPWRCFDALRLLIEAQGAVVDRQVFFRALWPDVEVEESSLTKVMTQLRRVLANGDSDLNYVETVPRLGYRLTMTAELIQDPPAGEVKSGRREQPEVPRAFRVRLPLVRIAAALVCAAGLLAMAGARDWKRRSAVAKAELYAEEAGKLTQQGDAESIQRAVGLLRAATELNPKSATHFAALAQALTRVPHADGISRNASREAAERAVALDPACSSGHAVLGFTLFTYFWEWERAGTHLTQALRLSPGNAGLRSYSAMYLSTQGRFEEALRQADEAVRMSPYFGTAHTIRSLVLTFMRRYEDAVSAAGRALSMNPKDSTAWDSRANALLQSGKPKEALASWIEFGWNDRAAELNERYRRGGMKAALSHLLEVTSQERTRRPHSYRRARWKAHLGDADGAVDELEIARDFRHFNLMYAAADPAFDPIRENPRFQRLLGGLGLGASRANQIAASE
jgi:DNA-binding winged helix-turn-helix (wHTH) protein